MMSQVQRNPGSEAPDGTIAWSPSADLRNCGFGLIKAMIASVEQMKWEPWFVDYVRLSGLTEADLAAAAKQFVTGLVQFLSEPPLGLEATLRASGFLDAPMPCQHAISASMGRYFLGSFAYAVGHAVGGTVDEELPYRKSMERLIEEGERIGKTFAQPSVKRIDRLAFGLHLLRPCMDDVDDGGPESDWHGPGRIALSTSTAVPTSVVSRLSLLGWSSTKLGGKLFWLFSG